MLAVAKSKLERKTLVLPLTLLKNRFPSILVWQMDAIIAAPPSGQESYGNVFANVFYSMVKEV